MKTQDDMLKRLYSAKAGKPELITVPSMKFLMIDGKGDPAASADFSTSTQALYGMAYTIKFALKKAKGIDFRVSPLEGLWWSDDMADFLHGRRQEWRWTLMIMQPKGVTARAVDEARKSVFAKKGNPAVQYVRFEEFREGRCAQVLHVGPYATEAETVRLLHEFIAGQGGGLSGKHHEIYLGDPHRTKPEKLRTILRQPFAQD